MQEKTITVTSLADLPQAAALVLDFANDETILLFRGEMAAGKTTLIKEICRQYGVEEPVSSPTYAIINEYQRINGDVVYHFDFYRINDEAEAVNLGVIEYFDSGYTCLIEWPSQIENLLPQNFVEVIIEKGIGEARTITLKKK